MRGRLWEEKSLSVLLPCSWARDLEGNYKHQLPQGGSYSLGMGVGKPFGGPHCRRCWGQDQMCLGTKEIDHSQARDGKQNTCSSFLLCHLLCAVLGWTFFVLYYFHSPNSSV